MHAACLRSVPTVTTYSAKVYTKVYRAHLEGTPHDVDILYFRNPWTHGHLLQLNNVGLLSGNQDSG